MHLFRSFFMGGFECSTHRLPSGKRLDLIESTQHDRHVLKDYQRLREHGILTARTGIRWHHIEQSPGQYDFSTVLPMLHAARETGIQLIWDICHYGWPEDLDIFTPEFVSRFARFAHAFAHVLSQETDETAFITPINEISFFSWAGGEAAFLDPYEYGRGFELKVQLARAAIAGMEAIWDVLPGTRMVHVDPVINILPNPAKPEEAAKARGENLAQYQGWDLLSGRLRPEIGGEDKYLDIIGANYYPANQWIYNLENAAIPRRDPRYKPFRNILNDVYQRYQRPMFVSETGAEDFVRAPWLRYIGAEVREAIRMGVPLHGICWYPILNHPGWVDDRHCHNGLWDYCDDDGEREVYPLLVWELQRQQVLFRELEEEMVGLPV
jgi:hypothetical protein